MGVRSLHRRLVVHSFSCPSFSQCGWQRMKQSTYYSRQGPGPGPEWSIWSFVVSTLAVANPPSPQAQFGAPIRCRPSVLDVWRRLELRHFHSGAYWRPRAVPISSPRPGMYSCMPRDRLRLSYGHWRIGHVRRKVRMYTVQSTFLLWFTYHIHDISGAIAPRLITLSDPGALNCAHPGRSIRILPGGGRPGCV
jgi:hypothetical protein